MIFLCKLPEEGDYTEAKQYKVYIECTVVICWCTGVLIYHNARKGQCKRLQLSFFTRNGRGEYVSSQDTSVGRKILSLLLTIAVSTRFCSRRKEKKRMNKKLLNYFSFCTQYKRLALDWFHLIMSIGLGETTLFCWYRRFVISRLVALSCPYMKLPRHLNYYNPM